MKKNVKTQNVSVPPRVEPDLAGFMAHIQQQLAFLENKMDVLISQTATRPVAVRETLRPVSQPSTPQASLQPSAVPHQSANEGKRMHSRRERVLHKAVCADCHKDCEIPFKPSGERPVYCKACFSVRKTGSGSPKPVSHHEPMLPLPPQEPERKVVVTKKGVGKVTVSEIVGPLVRNIFHKTISDKSAKKTKKG